MRLILIRHGEPDYRTDSLSENGKREVELLAQRVKNWKIDDIYVSPLGRAQQTAEPSLKLLGREAKTLDWLREFSYMIINPDHGNENVPWDYVPSHWTNDPKMLDQNDWVEAYPNDTNPRIKEMCKVTWDSLDELLSSYGFDRCGLYYNVRGGKNRRLTGTVKDRYIHVANELPEDDADPVIVFFCHYGISCMIMSHLLNIPFPLLTHGILMPTSSVTVLNAEERWDNQAYFRACPIGDTSHLRGSDVKISSAGSYAPLFQG